MKRTVKLFWQIICCTPVACAIAVASFLMLSAFSDTVPVVHQDFFNSETVIADEENQNPSSEFKAVSSTRQSSISNKTKRMAQEFPVPLLFNFSNETKCCLRTEQSAPDNRICDPDNPTRASPLS